MGFEPGGRADKYGNEYENRFLARLLLRIVNQELSFVIVEPLEEFSDSVEYVTESMDGTRGYYQCTAANASQKSWTFASLRVHSVFKRSMEMIDSNNDAIYRFISPLPYNEIDELCKRARTCGSSDEFIKYELTNKRIKEAFDKYVCELGLDKNNAQDMERCLFLLSHCDFEQVPFTETALQDLEERIGLTFTGSSSEVRLLLEHYVNGNGKYGVKITVYDIVRYLESCGHHLRNDLDCERVLSRIMTLNRDYWGACSGILGKIVHRDTSDDIIDAIMDNYSVVLHGKAGNGKSGCLEEVIDVLDNRGIPYLAINLSFRKKQIISKENYLK